MFRPAARTVLLAMFTMLATAVLAPAAHAACPDTWDGGAGTGDWSTGANWVTDVAPPLVDTARDICVQAVANPPVLSGQTVSYRSLTLEAGDIIATGTPEGVGFGRTPPEFLQHGDVLETEIEGIGVMRNTMRSEA